MKVAVLLLLAAVAAARPAEPEAAAGPAPPPAEPQSERPAAPQQAANDALVRQRRAPEDDGRGSVTGGVHREDGVGTVVQAQGQGTVWKSDSGNARVDAHGQWSKVVDGPGRGKPNYNVGIKFTGRF